MCMLCKEELLAGLEWREIKRNGRELASQAQSLEELAHIIDRMKELHSENESDAK
jgi:hypothetical protein